MSGIRIEGATSGNLVEVTDEKELQVNLSTNIKTAGYATIVSELDSGIPELGTTASRLSPETSLDYRLRIGTDTLAFDENFPGTVLNSSIWTAPVTTMTLTVNNSAILNANSSLTASAVARLSSYRYFPIYGAAPTYFTASLTMTLANTNRSVVDLGFGIASGINDPTDGSFFKITGGTITCINVFNGVATTSAPLTIPTSDTTLFKTTTANIFTISASNNITYFWLNDRLIGKLNNTTDATTSSQNLPVFVRVYNTPASAVTAQQVRLSNVNVTFGDLSMTKAYSHIMAGAGRHSSLTQTGSATIGQTAVWANSANPTAAAPTNTTAALGTGLGGIFIALINGLAVTTDYIIQSYQVPAGTASFPGKSLYITGISISTANNVVANGASMTTWALALAYGHTSVSLATTETATTKAPRRIPLGTQAFAANLEAGGLASPDVTVSFNTPIVVQPGEFVQVIMRLLKNTSAATETAQFYIRYEGYFE